MRANHVVSPSSSLSQLVQRSRMLSVVSILPLTVKTEKAQRIQRSPRVGFSALLAVHRLARSPTVTSRSEVWISMMASRASSISSTSQTMPAQETPSPELDPS